MTLTPSNCVGRLLPEKSEPVQVRVVADRFEPRMVIQVPGAMPGRKLAPLTTPPEAMKGPLGMPLFTNTHAAPAPSLSPSPPTMTVFPLVWQGSAGDRR